MIKDLYAFRASKWEKAAFTHSSLKSGHLFERLEFMGDRILAAVVADLLWKAFPKAREGELSKRSANLVCRATCEQIAKQIDLGKYLELASRSDLEHSSVLANALEAWIGAIYMDGGFNAVSKVIAYLWEPFVNESPFYDYKSKLQEWAQKHGDSLPAYQSAVKGNDHACTHMAEVCVMNVCASGSGPSRKAAEQEAAKALLDKLKKVNTVLFTLQEATSIRIDVWLARQMDVSRTRIQRWIDQSCIIVNGATITSSHYLLRENDEVVVSPPEPQSFHLTPQPMDLDIKFEDKYILVINKPAGLVVHPGPGHRDSTLIHGLLAHCGGSLCVVGDKERPGIVHRLDQHTSGLMVVAKTDAAYAGLVDQFQTRSLKRTYRALVWGRPRQLNFEIDAPIGRHPKLRQKQAVVNHGKESLTFVHVLSTWTLFEPDGWVSEWQCELATGRTHQIRVHAMHVGHPIIGDPLYGRSSVSNRYPEELKLLSRQALHAERLKLIHPVSSEEMEWEAELPLDYKNVRQSIIDRSEKLKDISQK